MPKKTPEFALLKVQVFRDCNFCDFAMYSSIDMLDSFIGCFFRENEGQTIKPGPNCISSLPPPGGGTASGAHGPLRRTRLKRPPARCQPTRPP